MSGCPTGQIEVSRGTTGHFMESQRSRITRSPSGGNSQQSGYSTGQAEVSGNKQDTRSEE
ncbi:MAG: hypothetical protein HC866_21205 [Leptolyngbyaceae cyanobacterium RU_5_1]|nr:hypothetical protein [Leptolyngbyaceae cyanobacterium RU_5_1]